jgi:hypothetical protein
LPVVFSYDAAEMGEFTERVAALEVTGPAPTKKARRGPGQFAARVLLPDGWQDVEPSVRVVSSGSSKQQPRANVTVGWGGPVGQVAFELYVDNRDGEATDITIGQLTLRQNAGGHSVIKVPAPREAENANVALNGKAIGSVPVQALLSESCPCTKVDPFSGKLTQLRSLTPQFLVDTSGQRRYRLCTVEYGHLAIEGSSSRMLRARHFHELAEHKEKLISFLEPSPEWMTVANRRPGDLGTLVTFELTDASK